MKNDRKYWYILLFLGVVGILNAVICSLTNEKPYLIKFTVINVHWITTCILLAGWAPFLFPQKTLKSETVIVTVNVISLCICISCALADLSNITFKVAGNPNSTGFISTLLQEDEIDTAWPELHDGIVEHSRRLANRFREHLFYYNCIDFALCVIAACISYKLIANRFEASPNVHLTDSRRFQGFGVALIIMAVTGLVNHLYQRIKMTKHRQAVFLDLHTIDEFCWLVINLATGILVFLSSRANQMVQSVSFVLSGATIYPCFFYAWLDYRIMTSASNSNILFRQSMISLMIAIPHMFVLLTIFLTFVMSRRDAIRVNLTRMHKLLLAGFAAFFFLMSLSLLNLNVYAVFTKQFYKVFYSSEQKLPFLSFFLALFTGLSLATRFNFITLAASLITAILAINATYLHIFSFIYLRLNRWYISPTAMEFLTLDPDDPNNGTESKFVPNYDAIKDVTESGVHDVEFSLNVVSLIGSAVYVLYLIFIGKTACPSPDNSEENSEVVAEKRKGEKRVLIYGVIMLIGALILLSISFYVFFTVTTPHPLVAIYSQLFHIVLALSITSYALFQVLAAEHVGRYPLFSCALIILSTVRGLDILTQMDYKDIATQPLPWLVHALIEYIIIFFHLATIAVIFRVEGAGRPLIEPAEIPLSFENPLGNDTNENGYIMLRTAENEPSEA